MFTMKTNVGRDHMHDLFSNHRVSYSALFLSIFCLHQFLLMNANLNHFPCSQCSDDSNMMKVINALTHSGLLCRAGIATSLRETGQQW